MIRTVAAALFMTMGLSGAAFANPSTTDPAKVPAGTYVLDKQHASLTAKIVHMGFSHYTLRFDGLDGSFTYDPANWQATKLTFTVDPKSVDTRDSAFDKQISGYFEPEKYPTITFLSTAVQGGADGKGTVTGDLTFHGVTKPVTLDVTFDGAGHGIGPLGTRLGFSGSTQIKRSDFGLNGMILNQFTSDQIDLIFEVEFEKK
ncbi:MAG TPA: YceI family protein [Phenylobacterium sp.]|jgi:polyisoprenoid-binding protein YceI|uniref:YceI family protein n=1 Tax=Phenylobacterium sp. TaxID=1871053 RepID=UPI002D36700E|nr:YceI family protein [Phenylobacterium sp.]HZZ66544.1 YceI family protein [Phenylobacterium sp.]